ncbi:hyphally regulated cell wall protein 3 [Senna tora]|uniref:Hyphally regulated cell wall protein 3 n=1 Tax=Senna tora TaxID=362788 RepID=A0A834SH47_9FABA|nr:hyphally regulated cell wall protein 3 [Senna tora]
MPSAAKKRKAAKKKKEKVATINPSSNSHTQGSDGFKSQDEKGSDGGEFSSSANPDHDDNYLSVNEGSEVEERDLSAAQSFIADMKSMEEVASAIKNAEEVERKEDSVVEIERKLKSEESSDSKNVNVEYTESAQESHYGNKNSTGNSKDESNDDPAMKRNDDKVHPFSDENVIKSSLEEPKPKEYDSKAPISSSSGSPYTTTGQEHVKDSESPESSENQPLIASTPPLVKKTSWLSCCGLFEVLSTAQGLIRRIKLVKTCMEFIQRIF